MFQLIDHFAYYENQAEWELALAESFEKYAKNNKKKIEYSLEFDYIKVEYTEAEINKILAMYDEKTQNIMERFVVYIDNTGLNRYRDLSYSIAVKKTGREYIKTSATTFSNTWVNNDNKTNL